MKKLLLILSLIALSSIAGLAQDRSHRVDVRERTQNNRIQHAHQTGGITTREGIVLHHEQRQIRRAERVAKADGRISRQERARLEVRQDRANRHIHRMRHNAIAN